MKKVCMIVILIAVLLSGASCGERERYSTVGVALGGLEHELVRIDVNKFEDNYTKGSMGGGFFLLVGGMSGSVEQKVIRETQIAFAVKLNRDNSVIYITADIDDIRFKESDSFSVTLEVNDWRTSYPEKTDYYTFRRWIRIGGYNNGRGVKTYIFNVPSDIMTDCLRQIAVGEYRSTITK